MSCTNIIAAPGYDVEAQKKITNLYIEVLCTYLGAAYSS